MTTTYTEKLAEYMNIIVNSKYIFAFVMLSRKIVKAEYNFLSVFIFKYFIF